MARSIWSGALSFGLVSVPVGLHSATSEHEVRFHQFERGTTSRIRYKRVNEDTGEEVAHADIVKGADLGDGRSVVLTDEELESVEPGRSRTIDISDFVDAAEIDPIYYQKSYYLAPTDETAQKPYGLLVAALEKADKIAIASFVMRNKEYLAAIRPSGDVLVLETMYFADEVRDPAEELDTLPSAPSSRSKDVQMAIDLIEAMSSPWDPTNYRDHYTDRVQQLVEAKRSDREVVAEEPEEDSGQVVDLVAALRASLEKARGHKAGNEHRGGNLTTRAAGSGGGSAKGGKGAGKSGKGSGGKGKGGRDEDVASMSKSELYALAQELDVGGRSSMTRDQLVEAVTQEGRRAG